MMTEVDLDGSEHKELWLEVQWKTGGEKMDDYYWVQNYLQILHPDSPGKYIAMTCSAEYMRDRTVATNVEIKNYYGTESFKVSDRGASDRISSFGTPAPADMQFFEKSPQVNYAYRSAYARKASW